VAHLASRHRDGGSNGIFMDVEADIVDDFLHGCLVLWCCC
jgi:hypothetical protein